VNPPFVEPPTRASADEARWSVGCAEDTGGVIRYTADRDLTDEEVADYQQAISFVLEHKQQEPLKLVVGNYREYRALEAAIAIAWTTSSPPQQAESDESLFHLQRVLLNWLTSLRLFDDHSCARLTRVYGRNSTELSRYDTARAGAYDRNPSYRFVCELRNYAQHCGQVPIQGSVHVSRSGREVELYFDRDELLAKFHNWKRVKQDLLDGPAHIPLDDSLEAAMSSIVDLARIVTEIEQPRLALCAATIEKTVGPPPLGTRQRPAIFRMRKLDAKGSTVTFDVLPVFRVASMAAESDPIFQVAPDFREDRPQLRAERCDFSCQGPIDRVTDLPAETCDEKASTGFYFPHQEGIAFLFGCDRHALAIGGWAGRRFGGCFGGEVAKVPLAMDLARKTFARVDTPHGEEVASLIPVPGAPTTSSLFSHPVDTSAESRGQLESEASNSGDNPP
jgi:hypothetical protein